MKLLICDFNKTLYDPIKQEPFAGAAAMLMHFKEHGYKIVLLTTDAPHRAVLINQIGLVNYVDEVIFVAQKAPTHFLELLQKYHALPTNTLILGDDPEAELSIGKLLQIPTVAVGTGYCTEPVAQKLGVGFCASIQAVIQEVQL